MDKQGNGNPESIKMETIDQIVAESAALNSRPAVTPTLQGRPKRGPGRPRIDGRPNRSTLKAIGAQFEETKNESAHASEQTPPGGDTSHTPPPGGPQPGNDFSDEMIQLGLKAPFALARDLLNFDGFQLSDQTARDATGPARDCINIYFPNLERSKHFPLYMLVFIIGIPAFKQTLDYFKFKNARHVQATVEPVPNPPTPAAAPSTMNVGPDTPNPFRPVFQ